MVFWEYRYTRNKLRVLSYSKLVKETLQNSLAVFKIVMHFPAELRSFK